MRVDGKAAMVAQGGDVLVTAVIPVVGGGLRWSLRHWVKEGEVSGNSKMNKGGMWRRSHRRGDNGGGGGFTTGDSDGSPAPCSDTRHKGGVGRHTSSSAGKESVRGRKISEGGSGGTFMPDRERKKEGGGGSVFSGTTRRVKEEGHSDVRARARGAACSGAPPVGVAADRAVWRDRGG
jgi:hypothetical protein